MELEMIPEELIDKQATAAIGQAELIKVYQRFFEDYGQVVAQILITSDVVNVPARKNNAANTLNTLLGMNIIPIINENDTVSTDDIELDDNYPLVVNVAKVVDANMILVKSHDFGKYLIIPRDKRLGNMEVKEEDLVGYLTRMGENVNNQQIVECDFPTTFKELNFY
jgi:glutamate 5-kinase